MARRVGTAPILTWFALYILALPTPLARRYPGSPTSLPVTAAELAQLWRNAVILSAGHWRVMHRELGRQTKKSWSPSHGGRFCAHGCEAMADYRCRVAREATTERRLTAEITGSPRREGVQYACTQIIATKFNHTSLQVPASSSPAPTARRIECRFRVKHTHRSTKGFPSAAYLPSSYSLHMCCAARWVPRPSWCRGPPWDFPR